MYQRHIEIYQRHSFQEIPDTQKSPMILKEILFWIGYYQIRVWSGTHPLQDLVKLAILLKKVHFMGVRGEHK